MGKVLVQCGASEEARRGVPAVPRPSSRPLEEPKHAAATGGAERKAHKEVAAPAAGARGADSGAAAQAARESDAAPAEVRAWASGQCGAAQ